MQTSIVTLIARVGDGVNYYYSREDKFPSPTTESYSVHLALDSSRKLLESVLNDSDVLAESDSGGSSGSEW